MTTLSTPIPLTLPPILLSPGYYRLFNPFRQAVLLLPIRFPYAFRLVLGLVMLDQELPDLVVEEGLLEAAVTLLVVV